MREVVFDCCVLSNFAFSQSLFILNKLYGNSAFITDFVSVEVRRGLRAGHKHLGLILGALAEGWIEEISLSKKEERELFHPLSVSLGLGEASSIAVAKARGLVFACDDRVARREAELAGVRLTGTLGILKKAVREKVIKLREGDRILAEMKAGGYCTSIRSLKEISV